MTDGLHDSLIAAALAELPDAEAARALAELKAALAALHLLLHRPPPELPPELAAQVANAVARGVRVSPWLRGDHQVVDVHGRAQQVLRMGAKARRDAGDATWTVWHAAAESARGLEVAEWLGAVGGLQ